MPASNNASFQDFIDLSVELTAFSEFELRGTGFSEKYYETIRNIVGEPCLNEILETYRQLTIDAGTDRGARDTLFRQRLMSSTKMGPIVRNIIKVWYVSTWYELPQEWRDEFGTLPNDGTFVVDAWAYPQGLLWPAVGAHPPGAKAPGYGSWAGAPIIQQHSPKIK
jgi:hypothetical protein